MIDLSRMWVITPYFNSTLHKSRPENYWKFMEMCKAAGVNVLTVEVAFGNRAFEVTERDNPNHVQLRSSEEFWLKENMINVGIRFLMQQHPEMVTDDGIICWIDADCAPVCPPREWFERTKLALDHFEIVQMFEYLIELGPDYQVINGPHRGFMASWEHYGRKVPKKPTPGDSGYAKTLGRPRVSESGYGQVSMGGPGLAWAAHVSTLNKLGLLIDWTILGAGDWWMAHSLCDLVTPDLAEVKLLPEYGRQLLQWQSRARTHIRKDVGFVKMSVYHWYHGDKVKTRFYGSRGQILIRHKFNPLTDLKYDAQGIWQLEVSDDRQVALRDDLRSYVHARNEDMVPHRAPPPDHLFAPWWKK